MSMKNATDIRQEIQRRLTVLPVKNAQKRPVDSGPTEQPAKKPKIDNNEALSPSEGFSRMSLDYIEPEFDGDEWTDAMIDAEAKSKKKTPPKIEDKKTVVPGI